MTDKLASIDIKIELVPIDAITPYEKNPRINDNAVDKVARSIQEFGFRQPIVVDKDNIIIAGHTRFKAAKQLGLKEVPVHTATNLTKEQIKAYRLADNRSAQEAIWDTKLLGDELLELKELDFDLELTAFDVTEINDLLNPEQIEDEDFLGASELGSNEEPVTKLGDVWLLGKHRLMCGDSLSLTDIDKLRNGQKAHMVFTSPPYNGNTHIDYGKGNVHKLYSDNKDNLDSKEYIDFLHETLANAIYSTDGFVFWNINYNANSRYEFIKGIVPSLEYLWETIIWKKTGMPLPYGLTRNIEFIFCFKTSERRKHLGNHNETNYCFWEVNNIGSQIKDHHACFPVELAEKAITLASDRKEIVLDIFGGSGTTLIACENLDRKCLMMEIDPKYCDIIIKRWQKETNKKAILESSGQSFDDMENKIEVNENEQET